MAAQGEVTLPPAWFEAPAGWGPRRFVMPRRSPMPRRPPMQHQHFILSEILRGPGQRPGVFAQACGAHQRPRPMISFMISLVPP